MLSLEQDRIFAKTWQLVGRYSVLRENGLHHFHELLTRALRSSKQ